MDIVEIAAPVKEYFNNFEFEFERKFKSNIPLADQVIQYIAEKKGKRLRPLLVFLSAALHGKLTSKTMSAGIVVEMFHTATLVHDDVVDESNLRRGARTVNDIWDNKISILIGDLLFSKTLSSIVDLQDSHAVAILSSAAEQITEGELLQIAFTGAPTLKEIDYFDLISKKTAALFAASCQLGALTVGTNGEALQYMEKFGGNYGIAFQIMDDLLDYQGDSKNLGKPTGNDLRAGKVTLPLIRALETAEEDQRRPILQLLQDGVQSDEQIKQIIGFAIDRGGIEYAKTLIHHHTQLALGALAHYPDSTVKKSLFELVKHSVHRDK